MTQAILNQAVELILNLFLNALGEASNWETEQPAGSTRNATILRTGADDPAHLVVDPSGALVFRQKLVPLQYNLEKFSNGSVTGGNRFLENTIELLHVSSRPEGAPNPTACRARTGCSARCS